MLKRLRKWFDYLCRPKAEPPWRRRPRPLLILHKKDGHDALSVYRVK